MVLAVILAMLTACGVNRALPDGGVVRKAIALQVGQAQQELSQQLRVGPPKVRVDRVKITSQEPLTIENLRAYRVQGSYQSTLQFSKRQVIQKDNPFEVYLQQQSEEKIWKLAQRQRTDGGTTWITQILE